MEGSAYTPTVIPLEQQLQLSAKVAAPQPPDRAAEILHLQMQTGLPPDVIQRDFDNIKQRASTSDFDAGKYARSSPIVAQWLAEDPTHFAAAALDLSHLNYIERQWKNMTQQYHEGQLSSELQGIGESAFLGRVTPQQRTRQAEIEQSLQQQPDYGLTGFFAGIPGALAGQVPMLGQLLWGKVKGAAAGAGVGAAVGAGAAAGEAAVASAFVPPAEGVTVPAAAASGAVRGAVRGGLVGWRYGDALAAARMQTALSYLDYEKLRDANGKPIDRKVLLGASVLTGAASGALQMVSMRALTQTVPGLRTIGQSEIRAALLNQTANQALIRYLKNIGEAAGTQGVVMFLQSLVKDAGGTLATMAQDRTPLHQSPIVTLDKLFPPDAIARASAAARSGFQGGLAFGAIAGGASYALDLRRANRAQHISDAFTDLGKTVAQTKLQETVPAKLQEVIGRLAANGPIDHVYLPIETWNTYWQGQRLDPALVASEVLGDRSAYDEAARTGGDLAIPTERYATTLAPSEHNAYFARELRSDPTAMNAREADQLNEQLAAHDAAAEVLLRAEPPVASEVQANVTTQLQQAGFDEATAQRYAELYGASFAALGQRTGLDPQALFERYGLQITQGRAADLPGPPDATLEQSPRGVKLLPGFYSKLEQTIQEKMGTSASKEQVQAMLSGVKQEEMRWTGFGDKLAKMAPDAILQKQDLLDFLHRHQLQVKEVDPKSTEYTDEGLRRDELGETVWDERVTAVMRTQVRFVREADGKNHVILHGFDSDGRMRAGAQVDLSPGGQTPNMPVLDYVVNFLTSKSQQFMDQISAEVDARASSSEGDVRYRYGSYTLPGGTNYKEFLFTVPKIKPVYGENPHFEEHANVVAHLRTTDRVDAAGHKMLFAEEIQSDWHQAGRERGYRNLAEEERINVAMQKLQDEVGRMEGPIESGPNSARYKEIKQEMRSLNAALRAQPTEIPEGPFAKTWPEFVLKRLITKAAAGGYDAIGWTTGKQQADRYDLAHQTDRIDWKIQQKGKDNEEVRLLVNGSKIYAPVAQLFNYVGKEMAVKISTAIQAGETEGTLTGTDLQVGGHGMRVFYDQILPQIAKDLGKKYGAKVEETALASPILIRQNPFAVHEHRNGEWTVQVASGNVTDWWWESVQPESEAIPVRRELHKLLIKAYSSELDAQNAIAKFLQKAPVQETQTVIHELALTPELKQAALQNQFPLFQGTPEESRGRISFGDHNVKIELLEKADPSTFIHETGHFYTQVLRDLATAADAPEQLKADWQTMREWVGAEGNDLTREQHEQIARGFEAYLMEGRAPTSGLRPVFARFRAWLLNLYQHVNALGVQLTPSMRGVFDRMLAADEEIKAAESEEHVVPLFNDPESIGMTTGRAADYRAAVVDAHQAAVDGLSAKLMRAVRREQTAKWQAQRDIVRQQVVQEVNNDPAIRARSILQRSKMPDGSALPKELQDLKLSKLALEEDYATEPKYKDIVQQLAKPYLYTTHGGLHPEQAAELLGFRSGDELLHALLTAERDPERLIERRTTERMRAEHGDLLASPDLPKQAVEAVHNAKRSQLLRTELAYLVEHRWPEAKGMLQHLARRLPTLDDVRAQAEATVADKRMRDITPSAYQRAGMRANREAMDAFTRGDIQGAFEAKQRELLNNELYRAAADARDQVDKVLTYVRRFESTSKQEQLKRAGGTYLEQIEHLLQRFNFKQQTYKQIAKSQSLLQWVEEQAKDGYTPPIPPALLDEARRTPYQQLSYRELLDVREAIRTIDHQARTKNRLLLAQGKRRVAEAAGEVVNSIQANHKLQPEISNYTKTFLERTKARGKSITAAHTKLEFLFEWLDGNKELGPVWRTLFKPFITAENDENVLRRGASEAARGNFERYPRSERAFWFYHRIRIPGMPRSFTKANILAVALNWGNDGNRTALMEGEGWTESQVQQILSHLDARDWQTVQSIWDHIESYWPQIAQLERDLNGLPPEKIEATPVETPHGTLRGGYYPIVIDGARDWRQHILDKHEAVKDLFGGRFAQAMTKHGHTIARDGTHGRPLRLDLSVYTQHINDVIHDLTHRRAIIDVSRITQRPEVRTAIEQAVGRQMYNQIHPWLQAIATGYSHNFVNPLERLLAHARMGATVVHLGWKMTTAVSQFLSYTNTVKEIGPKYASMGLADFYGRLDRIKQNWEFVTTRSEFMRDRISNYDRDVNDVMKQLNVGGVDAGPLSVLTPYTHGLRNSYFTFIGYMDMGASLPSWLGAYRKVMDGGVEGLEKGNEAHAIDYADKVIRQTQGVGAIKDLAAIQRGPEAYRTFTMFYSYWSVLFNQFFKTTNQLRMDRNVPKYVAGLALLWFVPAVLSEAITSSQTPSTDDDWEKQLKWAAKTEFAYPFQAIILLRDVINGMTRGQYNPSAAFNIWEYIAKTGAAVGQVGTGERSFNRSDLNAAVQAIGYSTHLPTRQLWLTLSYFYDWMNGNVHPDNVAQGLWQGLVTGKPRE